MTDPNATFDPQRDYLLPLSSFMPRLLGDRVKKEWFEEAAEKQALLIVMDKHLPVPDNLSDDDQKKYKSDALSQHIRSTPEHIRQEIKSIIPAENDLDGEIEDARAIVEADNEMPNTPPFKEILSTFIPLPDINTCLQAQAGLRIVAINEMWEKFETIPTSRVLDSDPNELKMVQETLENVLSNVVDKIKNKQPLKHTDLICSASAGDVAWHALFDAEECLAQQGRTYGSENIKRFCTKMSAHERVVPNQNYAQGYARHAKQVGSLENKNESDRPSPN